MVRMLALIGTLAWLGSGWPNEPVLVPTVGGPTLALDAGTLFHTLTSDFFPEDDGTAYVQTGDIPAMWLRDAAAQALPYVRFAEQEPGLASLVRGVIEHEARNVLTDPYANAFTARYRVWEQKWEVDSPAFPVTLLWVYWRHTHDARVFTPRVRWMLQHVVAVYACEQRHAECSHYFYGELPHGGRGAPFAETGMIWSGFRPSDDACVYPFNIPQNMLAVVALNELAVLAERGYGDHALADAAAGLAAQVRGAIGRFGRVYQMRVGWVYAYEVDGLGHAAVIGDANIPNLISATYFDYLSPDDALYQNTRRFILSSANPYFYHAGYAEGLGSAHTPRGWIWPLGIIMRSLTADDPLETADGLRALAATDGVDGLMHESFDPRRPWHFTRAEFGWANAMYAELIFRTAAGMPAERFSPAPFGQVLREAHTPVLAPLLLQWRNRAAVVAALERLSEPMFGMRLP
ncbi:metal-independent alpha-mannosidase [bacterium]|nr:MAG: metal-independent alpha-mannosidase [bacterium]